MNNIVVNNIVELRVEKYLESKTVFCYIFQVFLMDIQDTCVSSHASKRLHCRSRIRVQKWTDTLWNLAKLNRTTSIAGNSWWYQAEMVTRISEVHRHPPSCRLVAKIRPTICCFGRCDLIWHGPRWVRFEALELKFVIIFDNTYELLTIQIDRLYLWTFLDFSFEVKFTEFTSYF